QTVVNLIGAVTTTTGLKVHAELDDHNYPTGIRISDAALGVASHGSTGHCFQVTRPFIRSSSIRGCSFGNPRGAVRRLLAAVIVSPASWPSCTILAKASPVRSRAAARRQRASWSEA